MNRGSSDHYETTANKTMALLLDAGIACELTGQRRNRDFSYDACLSILNEEGEPL